MKHTPIGWPLRLWFVVELFFAISATIAVGLRPAATATNFAWTIKPEVTAALFGAFYAATAPVVFLVLFARAWENVRVFVLPGAAFTLAQLIVTFVHWDRFAVWTGPFNIWFASYLLPPPVFLACYWWQQRRAAPVRTDDPLPRWTRWGLWIVGGLLTLEALLTLVFPAWLASWAPWRITPLNARAAGGYFLLLGLMMLSMARENDRDRVRVASPLLVLALPFALFQLNRFAEQVDWRHPRLAIVGLLLAATCVLGLSLARGDWRRTLGR